MIGFARKQRADGGFTLVELLVTIAIIGMLASLVLVALFSAQEDAKIARTEAQIAKIHELIMGKWEEYETRPVQYLLVNPANPALDRLNALRELQRRELPDRVSDIVNASTLSSATSANQIQLSGSSYLRNAPALQRAYLRKIQAAFDSTSNPPKKWNRSNEGSECLYLILSTMHTNGRKAIEHFSEEEIGDTDNDNMPEILDAWGQPIDFLRWAPGHSGLPYSSIQPVNDAYVASSGFRTGDLEPTIDGNAGDVADPFDVVRSDPRWRDYDPNNADPARQRNEPFALYPLIYSGGPDERKAIIRDNDNDNLTGGIDYSLTTNLSQYYVEGAPSSPLRNDPYIHLTAFGSSPPVFVGTPLPGDDAVFDNISNHTLNVN